MPFSWVETAAVLVTLRILSLKRSREGALAVPFGVLSLKHMTRDNVLCKICYLLGEKSQATPTKQDLCSFQNFQRATLSFFNGSPPPQTRSQGLFPGQGKGPGNEVVPHITTPGPAPFPGLLILLVCFYYEILFSLAREKALGTRLSPTLPPPGPAAFPELLILLVCFYYEILFSKSALIFSFPAALIVHDRR